MTSLMPFMERRSRWRLLKAALRRRTQGRPSTILQEGRSNVRSGIVQHAVPSRSLIRLQRRLARRS